MVPPLVAVIRAVEPDLLRAFVAHYRDRGVVDFVLGLHFTSHTPALARDRLVAACERLVGPPTVISQGPWHETVHSEIRDHLRVRAGAGWHVVANVDEFHDYPAPLVDLVAAAEQERSPIVGGLLLDRVAADGSIRPWTLEEGLEQAFPLGGYLTPRLLGGNPGKVVVAHSSVRLGLGSHRSLDDSPLNRPLVPVHHFKWRAGLVADLTLQVSEYASGRWREKGPWIRDEASKMLDHLQTNGSCINVADRRLGFRPTAIGNLPEDWEEESALALDEAMQACDEHEWSTVMAPTPRT